jgi:histidine triad (HIT) family protein
VLRRRERHTGVTRNSEGSSPCATARHADTVHKDHGRRHPKEEKQRITDLSPASRAALLDGVAEVERKLTAKFKTTDFFVAVHDGPAAGQEVPHVHFHVIPREKGDSGKDMLACFPNTPPPGSSEPDFAGLAALSKELVAL